MVYGSAVINPTPSQAFDRSKYDPRGLKEHILDQADNITPANPFAPYKRVHGERDNSQSLIDMQS